MKIELPDKMPDNFKEDWPGHYTVFSHYETLLGIPHALFMVTTMKQCGAPNACYGGWSSFTGDGGGFFAIMPVLRATHTYANIMRDRQFVIGFIAHRYEANCQESIRHNEDDSDEIASAGLHTEASKLVKPPRIAEAFMSLECELHSERDLSGIGEMSLVIGRVLHAAVDRDYINGIRKYSEDGFMFYLNDLDDYQQSNASIRRFARLGLFE